MLIPKSMDNIEIKTSFEINGLHDELVEWTYYFSKFKQKSVSKEEGQYGIK